MKQLMMHLTCLLFSLLLVACDGFAVGRQTEPTAEGGQRGSGLIVVEEDATGPARPVRRATTPTIAATEPAVTPTTAVASGPAEASPVATPAAPPVNSVHAQGAGETLVLPGCFDFDGGVSVIPPDPAGDFTILPGPDSGTIEVFPVEAAQLAYGGVFPQPPSRDQCKASDAFSGGREMVAPMAAMYVCYRTGEGRIGYLHFTDADLEQAGTVTFEWLTFAQEDGGNTPGEAELTVGDELEAVLTLPETVVAGERVNLTFTLLNHADHPLYVLKWYTPLEGIAGEIFHIRRDGQVLPYQGILAMRGAPGPENYVLLAPGEAVTATVNLAQSYDFTEPGTYTVTFLSPNISHVARTEAEMARTVEQLGPVTIVSNPVSVTVVSGE